MNETVSIIVPVYKMELYLNRCIESIVNQTYRNLEIILVDDGSPDRCPHICDEWVKKDDRIKVIHKENAGVGIARNSGMEIATGNYLMFVDSDDYLNIDAVNILHRRLVDDETDMAIGKHIDVYEDGTTNDSFCRWMKNEVITREEMLFQMGEEQRYTVMACMKMYKREVFLDVQFPCLLCGEDCYLFPTIAERCVRISIVNELVYYYFQRSSSILHQMNDARLLDDIIANLELTKYFFNNGYDKAAQKWYGIIVDKATHLRGKSRVRAKLQMYFTDSERKKLLKGAGARIRLKWACLYVPFVLPIMRWVSRGVGRKGHEHEKKQRNRFCHPLG